MKRCPFTDFAFRPGPTAVAADDAADISQADACAFKLIRSV
jgi:hypothetical protein